MTTVSSVASARSTLRLVLRLDAVVTGANGLVYLALAGQVTDLLGMATGVSRAMGAFLLVYAAAVWAVSTPAEPRRPMVNAVVEANLLWTVLSVAAVVTGWLSLTTLGNVWALMQAGVVAGFAAVQWGMLRRSR